MSAQVAHPGKPRLLFVDDEKRVLNSMRAMFRRDYELFLTTRGDEALKIIAQQPIDVLVADQRMPLMTGVEVLTAAKKCSPGTVRILLTGYSDLDAIEGAMNEGEVFRFLNKPCAASELRGTILEAARIARDTASDAVHAATDNDAGVGDEDFAALSSKAEAPVVVRSVPAPAPAPAPAPPTSITERALKRKHGESKMRIATASSPASRSPEPERPASTAQAPAKPQRPPAPRRAVPKPTAKPEHAQTAKAPQPEAQGVDVDETDTMEIVMAGDTVTVVDHSTTVGQTKAQPEVQAPVLQPANRIHCVGRGKYNISVMVFSPDDHFARSIGRALDNTFYTFHATNAVRLIEGISNIAPAVLITDVTTDPDVIKNLTSMLKKKIPALVTMVAGKHRDAEVMISLINHGQVFRFIDKPLSSAGCHKHVREALKRHIQLRKNPELAKRYSVRSDDHEAGSGWGERILSGLNRVRRLWGHDS